MTRVSENSSFHSIAHNVSSTKRKLEDLQLKGSSLKRVTKPSDDPIGNIEILGIRSKEVDNVQFLRNGNYAKTQLTFTENAIEELSDIVSKAKEIGIGQASNFYEKTIRKAVAKEIHQLRLQAMSIGNRRINNRYIFGGHKTLSPPFSEEGKYIGDANQMTVEISKDFFVPINLSGQEVFFQPETKVTRDVHPLRDTNLLQQQDKKPKEDHIQKRDLASIEPTTPSTEKRIQPSLLDNLQRLENALITDNHEIIQDLLPRLDDDLNRLIEIRTKIGSLINSIENAESKIEKEKLNNAEYMTKIEDADVAELFTDITRQKNVLTASYKASSQLINKSLMDFIR